MLEGMTTVVVELNDSTYERLAAEARDHDVSVADMLAALAESTVSTSERAREMARSHLSRYPELFRKLAQ
jgi:hypothetical protein